MTQSRSLETLPGRIPSAETKAWICKFQFIASLLDVPMNPAMSYAVVSSVGSCNVTDKFAQNLSSIIQENKYERLHLSPIRLLL